MLSDIEVKQILNTNSKFVLSKVGDHANESLKNIIIPWKNKCINEYGYAIWGYRNSYSPTGFCKSLPKYVLFYTTGSYGSSTTTDCILSYMRPGNSESHEYELLPKLLRPKGFPNAHCHGLKLTEYYEVNNYAFPSRDFVDIGQGDCPISNFRGWSTILIKKKTTKNYLKHRHQKTKFIIIGIGKLDSRVPAVFLATKKDLEEDGRYEKLLRQPVD